MHINQLHHLTFLLATLGSCPCTPLLVQLKISNQCVVSLSASTQPVFFLYPWTSFLFISPLSNLDPLACNYIIHWYPWLPQPFLLPSIPGVDESASTFSVSEAMYLCIAGEHHGLRPGSYGLESVLGWRFSCSLISLLCFLLLGDSCLHAVVTLPTFLPPCHSPPHYQCVALNTILFIFVWFNLFFKL